MATASSDQADMDVISCEEGWALLEERARRYLNMSAREFIDAWQTGTIEDPDRPEVIRLSMLLPLAR